MEERTRIRELNELSRSFTGVRAEVPLVGGPPPGGAKLFAGGNSFYF